MNKSIFQTYLNTHFLLHLYYVKRKYRDPKNPYVKFSMEIVFKKGLSVCCFCCRVVGTQNLLDRFVCKKTGILDQSKCTKIYFDNFQN